MLIVSEDTEFLEGKDTASLASEKLLDAVDKELLDSEDTKLLDSTDSELGVSREKGLLVSEVLLVNSSKAVRKVVLLLSVASGEMDVFVRVSVDMVTSSVVS